MIIKLNSAGETKTPKTDLILIFFSFYLPWSFIPFVLLSAFPYDLVCISHTCFALVIILRCMHTTRVSFVPRQIFVMFSPPVLSGHAKSDFCFCSVSLWIPAAARPSSIVDECVLQPVWMESVTMEAKTKIMKFCTA